MNCLEETTETAEALRNLLSIGAELGSEDWEYVRTAAKHFGDCDHFYDRVFACAQFDGPELIIEFCAIKERSLALEYPDILLLAEAYEAMGNQAAAIRHYRQAYGLTPSASPLLHLARLESDPQPLVTAMSLLCREAEVLIEVGQVPRLTSVTGLAIQVATQWEARGEVKQAEAVLQTCLSWQPDNYTALLELGRLQIEQGNYEDAMRSLRQARQAGSSEYHIAKSYYFTILSLIKQGDLQDARWHLSQMPMLEQQCFYEEAHLALLAAEGQWDKLVVTARDYVRVNPPHQALYNFLLAGLERQGKASEAQQVASQFQTIFITS